MAHVSDEDAVPAFSDGRGVFDVDPHCWKLDAFILKHKLEARIESEDLLPGATEASGNRPVYYAVALWRKRSPHPSPPDRAVYPVLRVSASLR